MTDANKTILPPKRVAAIHDISGFGKCSLTVALPILSAAGIETAAMPTALLSTHTGGIEGYTFLDTTSEMRPFLNHWKQLDIKFDSVYSGFLGSFEQIDVVKEFIDTFHTDKSLVIVDPVMADNGELYKIFDMAFARGMRSLCEKADLIVPNLTEATLMLEEDYKEGPYSKDYIEALMKRLAGIGPKKIVLTGVYFDDDNLGAAAYDAATGQIDYNFVKKIPGYYHGTGDVFASALLASLLNGFTLGDATGIAVRFTAGSIQRTYQEGTDIRFGVDFERGFPALLKELKLV
jgi:pyridoxine kinase